MSGFLGCSRRERINICIKGRGNTAVKLRQGRRGRGGGRAGDYVGGGRAKEEKRGSWWEEEKLSREIIMIYLESISHGKMSKCKNLYQLRQPLFILRSAVFRNFSDYLLLLISFRNNIFLLNDN